LGRRKKGFPLHGWLIIDKPVGITSAGVVNTARSVLKAAKVGHGGTLDPMATGVLPLAFGEATKAISYVFDGVKEYRFTVRWGESRDTDDAEGMVTETSEYRPKEEDVLSVLPRFIGKIDQVPPAYSAVKIKGRRAYDLARKKQKFKLKARLVQISEFELLEILDRDHASFRVVSGKGVYMRALARDLALALGTRGHIAQLRRLRVGSFGEKDSISLDKLVELGHTARADKLIRPVETALDDIPALALIEEEARRLRCGQPLSVLKLAERVPLNFLSQGDFVVAMAGGKPVALACVEDGVIRPVRVLNL